MNEMLARDTSLVLKQGTYQAEIGTMYTRQETEAVTLLANGTPTLERLRSRAYIVPFSLRYGWTEKTELFAVAPFGMGFFDRQDMASATSDQTGVLGDLSAGLVHQLSVDKLPGHWTLPDTTFTLNVSAPTGARSVHALGGAQAALGSGCWRLGGGLNFVKSHDPFVVFAGFGYQYQFAEETNGLVIQRGDMLTYYSGVGFAATDDVSLSAQLTGAVQRRTIAQGILIPNSDLEPISLRLGYMQRMTRDSRIQPYVDFGLTKDAPDYTVGIRYTFDR